MFSSAYSVSFSRSSLFCFALMASRKTQESLARCKLRRQHLIVSHVVAFARFSYIISSIGGSSFGVGGSSSMGPTSLLVDLSS